MQSKNYPPNAKQKRFHDWVRQEFDTCSNCFGPAQELHHILGSSAKENKVWIGQWVVVMLCRECNHDDSRLPPKVDQVRSFLRSVLGLYWKRFHELPISSDELMAIATWSR